jgi:urea transport system ATP-binding protein
MPLDEELFTRQLPTDRFREQTDPVLQLERLTSALTASRR